MDDLCLSAFPPRWQLLLALRHLEWTKVGVLKPHQIGPVSFIERDVDHYLISGTLFDPL